MESLGGLYVALSAVLAELNVKLMEVAEASTVMIQQLVEIVMK